MKFVIPTLAALFVTVAALSSARADGIYPVGFCGPQGCCAPQGCYPGMNGQAPPPVYPYGGGPWNGGCVWVRPPCQPFNGMLPAMNNDGINGGCPLPQHPYARSPRDYFMYYERR